MDLDDFVGFLTNDRELNPEESDHFKSLFSGRLAGIDDPLPNMMLGGSRQGSALQSGRAADPRYVELQHRMRCKLRLVILSSCEAVYAAGQHRMH